MLWTVPGTPRYYRLILFFSCPSLEISHFFNEFRFLWVLRNHDLGIRCAQCFLGVIPSRPPLRAKLESRHIYSPIYIYIYLHIYILTSIRSHWYLQIQSNNTGFIIFFSSFFICDSLQWQGETWLALSTIYLCVWSILEYTESNSVWLTHASEKKKPTN